MAAPGAGSVGAPGPALWLQTEAALVRAAIRRGARRAGAEPEAVRLVAALSRLVRGAPATASERLAPFLAVVRSEHTGAAETGLALAALHKFLALGLLDPTDPSMPATVQSIADTVTHARFIGTDHSSDGVVLMKILQMLRTLIMSPEGAMLTGDSVCEIMLSCFRICFETRLSELLRRNAEQCLRDMIQHVFMRLPQFTSSINYDTDLSYLKYALEKDSPLQNYNLKAEVELEQSEPEQSIQIDESPASELPDSGKDSDTTSEISQSFIKSPMKKHGRHSSMDLASSENIFISQLVEKCVVPSEKTEDVKDTEEAPETDTPVNEEPEPVVDVEADDTVAVQDESNDDTQEIDKDFINPRGVRFTPFDEQANLLPYGISCVKELFRFLISLCNPKDSQNNTSMVYLGLCLVQTALEVSSDHLAKHPGLLQLIKELLSRHLLTLLHTDRAAIFALDLQVSFLLFESLRTHLKFQMQSFFSTLVEIIMMDNAKNIYEIKEITHLALESVAQMWRIPGLCVELYLNYDCDIYCSNVFEDMTKLLSKNILAAGNTNYHPLILEILMTVIESIDYNCQTKSELKELDRIKQLENKCEPKRYISIDIECDENSDDSVRHIRDYITLGHSNRHRASSNLPTPQQLNELKIQKRWIATGTELFNQKPEKGIEFLQEHGILTTPLDPMEVANFLKHNPGLDKKMIGEYITKKKNVESRILATYASSFDMRDLRIDQALRLYLETFRLPGEAPLIFLVMEHFAEQWHNCNGQPFANTDAAFRLAYAIIMLNMDQHNHNAKKLNVPMTIDDFVRNLRGCNGNNDFDKKMLEDVFTAIRSEEIVMPAEHTGVVKENYLWKVLLRKGATKDGEFMHCSSGDFDLQLFTVAWGPMVAALSSIFEKSNDPELYTQALEGFDRCASIVSHFSLTSELDTIILSLCKFTGLLNLPEHAHYIYIGTALGHSSKSQLALRKVFNVCHRHANSIREGWKHVLEVVLALFKGHLLPKILTEVDDFCSPTGKISLIHEPLQQTKSHETSLFSSLYSYIALSSDSNAMRNPNPDEMELIDIATECVVQCNIDSILLTDTKFLQLDSLQELIKYLISAGKSDDSQPMKSSSEDPVIFFLELLIKIIIQNRDRVSSIWSCTEAHVTELMKKASDSIHAMVIERRMNGDVSDGFSSNLLERSSIGLLRLAINLMRNEECASEVLHSLNSFLELSYPVYHRIANQIAIGLFELVKTSAQNIHSANDWSLVFVLLETTGAGAMHLKHDDGLAGNKSDGAVSSEDDSVSTDRGYTSDGELSQSPPAQGWILVNNESENDPSASPNMVINPLVHPCALKPHNPNALLKCWECLAFIVRDVAHITPYNFKSCVDCIRTFVEASLNGTNQAKITMPFSSPTAEKRKKQISHSRRMQKSQMQRNRSDDSNDDVPEGYQLISIQLLDLMHTLHSRTAQIFKWWREEANLISNSQDGSQMGAEWGNLWDLAWQPLLQGIARLCTDKRKQVSNSAVTYLQRALLVHDLQTLSGEEWEACFHRVLFPLLSCLTKHDDDIRLRANTIMCKVFLHHLTPLMSRESFEELWLGLLTLMQALMTGNHTNDLLYEATLESLKNMLLVMDSVKVFSNENGNKLWNTTWERINLFLPKLKDELFKPIQQKPQPGPETTTPSEVVNLSNNQPSEFSINNNLPAPNPVYPPNAPPMNQNQILNPLISATQFKGSSILLQPPSVGSQVHSPLFTHLGQMVSTPIGVASSSPSIPNVTSYPLIYPNQPALKHQLSVTQPSQGNQIFNTSYSMVQSVASSQFALISPHTSDTTQNAVQPANFGYDREARPDQPRSLFGEYMTDPYNEINRNRSEQFAQAEAKDVNFNRESHVPQKSQSVTSSPLRSPNQVNSNFGSSDNIKHMSDGDPAAFNLSRYFHSDPPNIPPGSEILFGHTVQN